MRFSSSEIRGSLPVIFISRFMKAHSTEFSCRDWFSSRSSSRAKVADTNLYPPSSSRCSLASVRGVSNRAAEQCVADNSDLASPAWIWIALSEFTPSCCLICLRVLISELSRYTARRYLLFRKSSVASTMRGHEQLSSALQHAFSASMSQSGCGITLRCTATAGVLLCSIFFFICSFWLRSPGCG